MDKIKVVHYVNQFFAGIGGEEKADTKPFVAEQLPPISAQLQKNLGDDFEIVATIVCGDSYFNENLEEAKAELIDMIGKFNPDYFIAGPAFNAGRYGMASGTIAKEVQDKLGIKSITAMYDENPGRDMFAKDVYVIKTADSAAGMRKALKAITAFTEKYAKGEDVGTPEEGGYFPQGRRINYFSDKTGSARAVEMLLKKISGEEYETEYPMPAFDRVEPAKAIKDITKARIAIVTSGGIVPKGNPDHIESSSASKFGRYDFSNITDLTPENSETAHGGYDPVYANENADRVIPVDVLRNFEKEGKIGSLHHYWYSTVGNGTAVASAKKFSEKIAEYLKEDKVDAVILTST